MRKQPLTPDRITALLADVQFIATVAQLVENRFQNNLVDVNLRGTPMANFARKIRESAEGIKRELSTRFRLKDRDELTYDMAAEMDRVVSFFCMLRGDAIATIMDVLEAEHKELMEKAAYELCQQHNAVDEYGKPIAEALSAVEAAINQTKELEQHAMKALRQSSERVRERRKQVESAKAKIKELEAENERLKDVLVKLYENHMCSVAGDEIIESTLPKQALEGLTR